MVVFDLDNTLYSYNEAHDPALEAVSLLGASELGITTKTFISQYEKSRDFVKARLGNSAASHSRLLYIHELLTQIGFSNQPRLALQLEQEYWRNYMFSMKLREGAQELLETLRFARVPTILVTDLTLQIQIRKLIHLKLDMYFDLIIASEEVSGDKNTLEPFRLMVDRCDPDWLRYPWFIGDNKHDAPIDELITESLIFDGESWISTSTDHKSNHKWSSFRQIEKEIEKLI